MNCILIILAGRITLVISGLSIITLSAITLERYIGVLHPYSYKTKVTKRRIFIYVGGSSLTYCLVVPYRTLIRIVLTGMVLVFLIFATFVYTKIYFVIQKLVRSERKLTCDTNENRNATRQAIRESKHAKSCFLVVITFVLLLMPSTLAPAFYTQGTIHFIAYVNWTFTLLLLNSSVNSVIFFWTKVLLRNEAIKTLKSFFSQA